MQRLMLILAFGLFASASCGDSDNYACYGDGGGSDHCWEAKEANEQSCNDQNRTFAEGDCSDFGYDTLCPGSDYAYCR